MDKYRVKTDQGTFIVTLDQPVASQEELMALVEEAIGGPTPTEETPKAKPRPEGFFATMGNELSEGSTAVAEGIKRTLSGNPLGILQSGMGGLQMAGSPMTATGAKAGELTQDMAMGLGMGPTGSAAFATAADIGTQLVGLPSLARRGVSRIGRMFNNPSATTVATQAVANKFNIPITAADLTQSRALGQLEGIPTRFPLGVSPVAKFGERQVTAVKEALSDIGGKVSPTELTPTQAGELFKETMAKAQKTVRSQADDMYSAVKQAIPENGVFETPYLLNATKEIGKETALSKGIIISKGERTAEKIKSALAAESPESVMIGGKPATVSELKGPLGDLIKKHGMDNPDRLMTYEGMDLLRKDLRQALRDARKAQNDVEVRRLSGLIDGLSEDMRAAADKFPGASLLHEKADQFYRAEVAPYFTKGKLPRKLSDTDASQLVKSWIWGNKDRPENINVVKKALNKPEDFRQITRAWWEDLATKSTDPKTQEFSIGRFLTNYNRFSPGVRAALLGPTVKDADQLVSLMAKVTAARYAGMNPSQSALGIFGVAQGSLALDMGGRILTGDILGAVKKGTLLLAPKGLAHVVTSPTGIKLLSRQLTLPPGSPEAAQLGTRIVAIANSALNKSEIAEMLRDTSMTLEDKIAAGQGLNP